MVSSKVKLFVGVSVLLLFSTIFISLSTYTLFFTSNQSVGYPSTSHQYFKVSTNQKLQGTNMVIHETNELNVFAADFNYSTTWIKKLTVVPSKYDMYEKAYELSQFASRHVSMPGNNETRDLIESYLSNEGVSYTELWFPVNYSDKVYHTANIIVNLSPLDPKKETVLLLAHYDSLSYDFRGKPYPQKAPGADDDLSGVVALLYFIISMKKAEAFGFEKNVVAVFLSGEEDNYAGSRNALAYFSNVTNINSVIYIDEVGKAESNLAIFYGDLFSLLKSATRANTTLSVSVRDMKSPRDSSFVGCGESVFREKNIPTLVLSETNYDNLDTHTEHDTLDKLSMDKIVNATIFLEGTVIDYAVNFPRNSSIVDAWKQYFTEMGLSIRNISSLQMSSHINTFFVADLPNSTLLAQLRNLDIKKIVYLSESAIKASKVNLGQESKLIYDIKPNYFSPSLMYHPLLLNTSICNTTLDFGIGFTIGHGLDLLEFENMSLMKLLKNSKGNIELYFTPIKPMNGLKKLFLNIISWNTFISYFYITPEKAKYMAGDLMNLSLYAKDPISWKPVDTSATLTIYSPINDIILSKELVFSGDAVLNLSLYARYPGIYQFQFEDSREQEAIIQTLNVDPAVLYHVEYPEFVLQGDNLRFNVSLNNVSNKTLSLTYYITNSKERTVNTGDFILPAGETNMTLLSPEIWSWENTTIELKIESQQIFVVLQQFLIAVKPGLAVNVTPVDSMGQLETCNITLNILSSFKVPGMLLINASGDFIGLISERISSGQLLTSKLPVSYQVRNPYDIGLKRIVLSFYFNGHLVYQTSFFIRIVYSAWGIALGFVSPMLFVGLGVLFTTRRFTRPPPEVIAENRWLWRTRKYNETIYLTKKEPAKKILSLFVEKTAMKIKKGPFFTVYYNHSMILVVREEEFYYTIQCYSDNPKLVINTCLHFSIYAVPPRHGT